MMQSAGMSPPSNFALGFEYLSRNNPEKFVCFVLQVPDGVTLFWSRRSVITMTYTSRGDTFEVDSSEHLVIRKCDLTAIHGHEVVFSVPMTGKCDLFHTPRGDPVLFAKFPVSRKPDSILRCVASNVMVRARVPVAIETDGNSPAEDHSHSRSGRVGVPAPASWPEPLNIF